MTPSKLGGALAFLLSLNHALGMRGTAFAADSPAARAEQKDILDESHLFQSPADSGELDCDLCTSPILQGHIGGGTKSFTGQLALLQPFSRHWYAGASLEYQEKVQAHPPSRLLGAEIPMQLHLFPQRLIDIFAGLGVGYEQWQHEHQKTEHKGKTFYLVGVQLKLSKNFAFTLQRKHNTYFYLRPSLGTPSQDKHQAAPTSLFFTIII